MVVQVLEIVEQLVQLAGAGVGLYTAVLLARRARPRLRRRPVAKRAEATARVDERPQDEDL
ncbi:hypothetical protein ACIBCT_37570 [Streptosporangium sp. NPDC050855]|uniref:hypothetical protein n=1 Tax=Streptosporangium sp. NPDC050855 TaxID=3366194 RepID=UPI0037A86B8C